MKNKPLKLLKHPMAVPANTVLAKQYSKIGDCVKSKKNLQGKCVEMIFQYNFNASYDNLKGNSSCPLNKYLRNTFNTVRHCTEAKIKMKKYFVNFLFTRSVSSTIFGYFNEAKMHENLFSNRTFALQITFPV